MLYRALYLNNTSSGFAVTRSFWYGPKSHVEINIQHREVINVICRKEAIEVAKFAEMTICYVQSAEKRVGGRGRRRRRGVFWQWVDICVDCLGKIRWIFDASFRVRIFSDDVFGARWDGVISQQFFFLWKLKLFH